MGRCRETLGGKVGLAHIPEKWIPVFRKGYAPAYKSGAHFDSVESECALVWRFRSPHHPCRAFVMRTSEPKPH